MRWALVSTTLSSVGTASIVRPGQAIVKHSWTSVPHLPPELQEANTRVSCVMFSCYLSLYEREIWLQRVTPLSPELIWHNSHKCPFLRPRCKAAGLVRDEPAQSAAGPLFRLSVHPPKM